ncbi:MAG: protein translocase subunit SecF, partial [Cyclobacteriaceae bacterium]|nr:protein translocase subunit SecF [Cyclobacteriaceae bacterium]
IDANVTTFLIGLIMYVLGQGPLKGFATTLMIGIASSFFSAVFITRVIVTWLTKRGDKSNVSFSMPWSKNLLANLNVDFLNKRKIAYVFSSVFIVSGLILIIFEGGLNLGVDFTGGRSYIVEFQKPVSATDLKTSLQPNFENAGTEVKWYGSDNVVKVTTSYLISDESVVADSTVESALIQGISRETGLTFQPSNEPPSENSFAIAGSSKVGATIADDIKTASMESVIFALIVIFIYIVIRFRKWQFGLGAVIALFHDTLFVLAAYAIVTLFGKYLEIDQVFIAAMLTIIGYSINDTVVIFDRIRENMQLKAGSPLKKVLNESINDTLSRTLITSFTTLIVVIILLIFGGEILRGFSFALLIGIIIGSYSTIFIATPIVLDLTREKKKTLATKSR